VTILTCYIKISVWYLELNFTYRLGTYLHLVKRTLYHPFKTVFLLDKKMQGRSLRYNFSVRQFAVKNKN